MSRPACAFKISDQHAEHADGDQRNHEAVQNHQAAGEKVRGGFLLLKRPGVERLMPAAQRVQKSAVRVRGVGEPPVKFAGVVERADGVIQLHAFFERGDDAPGAAAADFVGGGFACEPDGLGFRHAAVQQHGQHGGKRALQFFSASTECAR